ncbi:MAG: chromosome segregation protein SMC [Candidatus Thorarchaeota archaeon]|nr:chromosome segregation protein SMC [Candidatus Thorarchaeota archaeon]
MGNIRAYIESAKLDNFLSFYSGRVTFDKGLTVLAGPNGSGKTSIFHALKFALGSNQRENRYNKWSDFIRHGASTAEVEVIVRINGQNKKFQRKIDRDGIPRSYVDGRRVKAAELRQIVQTFGLDTDNPLVFIPQERINAVRDMDPYEVRKLVEEGTGLDVLRDRIILQETEVVQSRQRLAAALTESKSVERELELLQHDLDRLEKKRSLQEQEKLLERDLKWATLVDLMEKIDVIKTEIEGKEAGLVSILEEQTQIQSEISENEREIESLETRLSNLQIELGRVDAKIEEEERNLTRIEGDSQKQVGELKHLEKEVNSDTRNKEKLQEDIERISSTKEETMEKQRELRTSLQNIEDERTQIREALEAFAEWNTKRAETHGRYKALQAEMEGKDLLMRSVRERLQVEEAELQSIESKWSHVWSVMEKSDEKELVKKKGQLEREIATLNEDRFRQSSLVSQLQKEIDELNVRLSETSKRVPETVRQLKEAINEHKLGSVTGPLIELFSADDSIASAIEAVIPDNMTLAFIVTDETDFQILQKLRDNVEAPSPLILLKAKEKQLERPIIQSVAGVEGWLWDKLNIDDETQKLLRQAIGDFVLTKSAKSATRLASKENIKAVSIDGHVIIPYEGKIVSNPKIIPSGMISTAPLQSRLSRAIKDLAVAKKHVTDIMVNLDNLTNQREEVLDLLSQMTRWSGTWERRGKLIASIPEQEERLVALDEELKVLHGELENSEKELRKLDNIQPPERSRLIGQDSALRIKHRQLQTDLTKIDSRANAAERDEELKRRELKQLIENITMLTHSLNELRTEIMESKNAASGILEKIEAMKISQEEMQNQKKILLGEMGNLKDANREMSGKIVEFNLIIKERKLQVLQSKRHLTNMEYELENIERDVEGITRPEKVRPLEQVRNELVKLRYILDDYQDVSESVAHTETQLKGRLATLIGSVKELQEELDEAESAVENIQEQYHNGMNETLRYVEKNVNEVLGSVQFPGSVRFELALREGNYGVEFKSRIKAEGFGDISAGSGGERSLIAISLILALQRFNPAPVYVLDEVDTFLDATNTELVSRLFHDASRRSQFVLLTPAKSTHLLKHADKILGIVSPNGVEPSIIIESPKFKGKEEGQNN